MARLGPKPDLVEAVKAAKAEAKNHPEIWILDAYSLNPEKLSPERLDLFKAHLESCKRCQKQVEALTSFADFHRRQKPPCD